MSDNTLSEPPAGVPMGRSGRAVRGGRRCGREGWGGRCGRPIVLLHRDVEGRGEPPEGVRHLLPRRAGGDGRWSLDPARAVANGTTEALDAELEAERAEHARPRPGNPLPVGL